VSTPLLVVVGPTASGKTSLACALARELSAEIVSADSQQCYRGLDAGTAKPTAEERSGAPHHLLDVADPEEQLDAARFVQLADAAIAEIARRGKRIIVAGGTGLWIRALLRGLLDAPGASGEFRARFRGELEVHGLAALHARLATVDPEAARAIRPNDRVRIERALEVHALSGRRLSELQREHSFAEERYPARIVRLEPPRELLQERIARRTRTLFESGAPRRAQGPQDHRVWGNGGRARRPLHTGRGGGARRRPHAPVREAAADLVHQGVRRDCRRVAARRGAALRRGGAMVRGRLETMSTFALEFEKPLLELEQKLAELKRHAATGTASGDADALDGEIRRLERRCGKLQQEIFAELTRWQVVQLSRHPNRPYMLDYVQRLFTDWIELHGDRSFADDQALVAGLARFDGEPVLLLGQQKGRSTKENLLRSFGMPRPEGYRKALRLMKLAERFDRPVIAFIDTPGAYPGIDAEERGQAEAIAVCLEQMAALQVPSISVVIGEGGSGGALAIGVCNRLLMLQYSWYSVISPESCAAILYRDSSKGQKAAEALKLTARDAYELGIVDELVEESAGGAHRDPDATAENLRNALRRHLRELRVLGPDQIVEDRYRKFRKLGPITEPTPPTLG